MKREDRTEKIRNTRHFRGYPPRSNRAEREVLNRKPNGHMPREERETWNIPPRVYATLKRVISDLEIIISPLDHSGDCASSLKYLRRMERKSSVRWGKS